MSNKFKISAIVGASCFAGLANAQLIFNGGGPDQGGGNEVTQWVQAEDFSLASNETLAAARFWTGESGTWDGTLHWWVFNDSAGTPGSIVASGSGTNIVKVATGGTPRGNCSACALPKSR